MIFYGNNIKQLLHILVRKRNSYCGNWRAFQSFKPQPSSNSVLSKVWTDDRHLQDKCLKFLWAHTWLEWLETLNQIWRWPIAIAKVSFLRIGKFEFKTKATSWNNNKIWLGYILQKFLSNRTKWFKQIVIHSNKNCLISTF